MTALRRVLLRLAVLLVFGGSCGPERPAVELPNIVLIVGDDHGYPYAGFMGNPVVQTPHLDRLAREGTVFRTAYGTASSCRPSLRSLLTGLHPYQWEERSRDATPSAAGPRRRAWGRPWIPTRALDTLPRLLAERGYVSYQAGKLWDGAWWHWGFSGGTKGRHVRGRSVIVRMAGGADGLQVGRTTMQPVYDFIDAHAADPFFLWFAPLLPHTPFDAPKKYRERYAGQGLSVCAVLYYANISRLDDAVGDLVAYLERKGLRARTLVAYVSDNGFEQAPHDDHRGPEPGCGGGPRGKGSMHELGFRTLLVLNWPGHVPAQVIDDLVSTVDLFPTLLDLAGLSPPGGRTGRSLRPLLAGARGDPGRRVIGHAYPLRGGTESVETFFLRTAEWHYVSSPTRPEADELYHVTSDPEEAENLVAAEPALVEAFRRAIAAWRAEMDRLRDRGVRARRSSS